MVCVYTSLFTAQVVAAFTGVAVRQIFLHISWLRHLVFLQGAFAVSLTILHMNLLHAVRGLHGVCRV